jgi:hypothetical protein
MTSRIKDAMFSVFGESQLDNIKTNSPSSDIAQWKMSSKTIKCYKNLFRNIMGEEVSFMTRIFEKVWPSTEVSEELSAYAIGVCEFMLNPKTDGIQMNEKVIKRKILKNRVNIRSTSKLLKLF